MTEADVETIMQRIREVFPDVRPRTTSDNGPQFIAKDFQILIRPYRLPHVTTSTGVYQRNGKNEGWREGLKG